MSKVFISYRRKSWPFTRSLADALKEQLDAEIFWDVEGIDKSDFETSILNHLRTSNVVLLVITDLTFTDRIQQEDDWVRREIREALMLELPLVMVCVDGLLPPSTGLPEDIKAISRLLGINFYPEYFIPAVERLVDFVMTVSEVKRKGITGGANITLEPFTLSAAGKVESTLDKRISGKISFDEALDLMEQGDFAKAIFLLEGLRENGYESPVLDITDLLEEVQLHQQKAERRRTAQIDYEEIAGLVKRRVTHERGIAAYHNWQQKYPDLVSELDIENIRTQSTTAQPVQIISRSKSFELMPQPFDWIKIPAGKVTLGGNFTANGGYITEATDYDVKAFSIAKYPITNAQFNCFIEAAGYNQRKFWTSDGWKECKKGGWAEPLYWGNEIWNKSDYPVVGVSWFEAIAFCQWLSEVSKELIMLSTDQQWQRAAHGDTQWAYPYGNQFDGNRCNFNTTGLTKVTQYEGVDKGNSPFGVVDMSGNVWEWCLTKYESSGIQLDGDDLRVQRGGSWWIANDNSLRTDYRNSCAPSIRNHNLGFRIARN